MKNKKYLVIQSGVFQLPEKFNGDISDAMDWLVHYLKGTQETCVCNEPFPLEESEKQCLTVDDHIHHINTSGNKVSISLDIIEGYDD